MEQSFLKVSCRFPAKRVIFLETDVLWAVVLFFVVVAAGIGAALAVAGARHHLQCVWANVTVAAVAEH